MKAGPSHSVRSKGSPEEGAFKDLEFEYHKWSGLEGAKALGAIPGTEN